MRSHIAAARENLAWQAATRSLSERPPVGLSTSHHQALRGVAVVAKH